MYVEGGGMNRFIIEQSTPPTIKAEHAPTNKWMNRGTVMYVEGGGMNGLINAQIRIHSI